MTQKIIKTTKAMRDLYVKHMEAKENCAKGNFIDSTCYMCSAAEEVETDNSECSNCPLHSETESCHREMRLKNLVDYEGNPTQVYRSATPESIRKHIRWMEKRIKRKTDCELYWKDGKSAG